MAEHTPQLPDGITRAGIVLDLVTKLQEDHGLPSKAADAAADLLTASLDLAILGMAYPDDPEITVATYDTANTLANTVFDVDPANREAGP